MMDKTFIPSEHENKVYGRWGEKGLMVPVKGKPFTILMPPPNANASLHAGHGMYTIDDILIRWKRLNGFASLWIPGLDHAGLETQYVYEKYLSKQGKSRFDFNREDLYKNIKQFVQDNGTVIFEQFKKLGFLADWKRSIYTLDESVISFVYKTFEKLYNDGLIYRDDYIVNYCIYCGTSLSDLEVLHEERKDPLYYIRYGPFTVATVRPETKFGDTAVAVHPKDKRYMKWIGKEIEITDVLGKSTIRVISDIDVDPKFGTGALKVTPAHDSTDFQIGKRHNLEIRQVIGIDGKMNEKAGKYEGLRIRRAREEVVKDLQTLGLIEKIDTEYQHAVTICYKCKRDLEPMLVPNWYLRVESLKKKAEEAVKKNKVTFFPLKFKKHILQWFNNMRDWPISRQNVWGIRIPVWYEVNEKTSGNIFVSWLTTDGIYKKGNVQKLLQEGITLEEILTGLQKVTISTNNQDIQYVISQDKPEGNYLPETDTFDTWFSSGQWPLVTMKEKEYSNRFPTDVLGTLSDILPFWVSRMIMFSLYARNDVPFKKVYLWSMVADSKGLKMSKSKGNVINPIDLVDKYGADAFRLSLIFGTAPGGKVILAEEKVKGMRNFVNKVWNMGRYLEKYQISIINYQNNKSKLQNINVQSLIKEIETLATKYKKYMEGYQFAKALEVVYEFMWHRFADVYIEQLKEEVINGNIEVLETMVSVYKRCLILLHPFAPFVTDTIWGIFHKEKSMLETS
jgi:valyl-tRNA synthetase